MRALQGSFYRIKSKKIYIIQGKRRYIRHAIGSAFLSILNYFDLIIRSTVVSLLKIMNCQILLFLRHHRYSHPHHYLHRLHRIVPGSLHFPRNFWVDMLFSVFSQHTRHKHINYAFMRFCNFRRHPVAKCHCDTTFRQNFRQLSHQPAKPLATQPLVD